MRTAILVGVLAAVVSAQAHADKPSPRVERMVKEAVREVLKDPQSAQFESLDTFVIAGRRTTCGQVNAKNSYGGYTGKTLFWTHGTESEITIVRFASDGDRPFLLERCNKGLMIAEATAEQASSSKAKPGDWPKPPANLFEGQTAPAN